jgi:hypothetical protein
MNKLAREAKVVAAIFGAKQGSKKSEQMRALISGLKMAGGSKRQIAKWEAEAAKLEAAGN